MSFQETKFVHPKSGKVKTAFSPADAVRLKFDGFKPFEDAAADLDYHALQAQAKAEGIPANQSKDALVEALTAPAPAPVDSGEGTPDVDETDPQDF